MKTIVIIAGIVLTGAAVIGVVQSNKNQSETPATQQNSTMPVSADGTPLLNPEHGVAGHRCDLPVGAPLSSSSGTPAPGVNQIPMQTTPSAPPAGVTTNPAHGLPGHRCDLPVGAPLG
jgi:hypothetical protein